MRKLLLIYNPYSGQKNFKDLLDEVVDILQDKGNFKVILYRMSKKTSLCDYLSSFDKDELDTVCVSGGDGTINIVLNELYKNSINAKIGLFPSGTANDFCSSLGFTKDIIECANRIAKGETTLVDLGKINSNYFVNVLCVGLFAEVSQGVDVELKQTLGKLAYYVQGAKVLTKVNPLTVKITTSKEVIEAETYLILVLNSDRAGGFKIAPLSTVNDGLFDLVLFKAKSYQIATATLLKVLNGNHINDENVIYLQDNYFKIECLNGTSETDVDGEKGPALPLEISVLEKQLEIYY